MGANSSIEWTDHTFNPWIGCSKISDGCKNCYASVDTFARRSRANGLELWGKDAARHRTSGDYWKQPFKWDREAQRDGVRRRVFCASLADVFEDRRDLDPWRAALFSLIARTSWLDWLLLTKRPEQMTRLTPASWSADCGGWPPNAWALTTVENQEQADRRVPELLKVPARVRGLSVEPLLCPIDLRYAAFNGADSFGTMPGIAWCIVGGESGAGARPCALEWIEDIVDQCQRAGAAPFVKQLGARPFTTNANLWNDLDGDVLDGPPPEGEQGAAASGVRLRDRKGGDIAEFPIKLRVREFPSVR